MFSVRILQTSELLGLMYQISMCKYERDRVTEFQCICEPEQALNLPFLRLFLAKVTVGSDTVGFMVDKMTLLHPT